VREKKEVVRGFIYFPFFLEIPWRRAVLKVLNVVDDEFCRNAEITVLVSSLSAIVLALSSSSLPPKLNWSFPDGLLGTLMLTNSLSSLTKESPVNNKPAGDAGTLPPPTKGNKRAYIFNAYQTKHIYIETEHAHK
jgi:hypothetical protein